MAENSAISWTHHTFNPWRGCTKVSEGCRHCYAETFSGRNPGTLGVWGPLGTREVAAESYWKHPIKWNREAEKAGERRRVFCASLADVFEAEATMPKAAWEPVNAARRRLWDLIEETPWLDWLLLTKRPEKVKPILAETGKWSEALPLNVWMGATVENQEAADKRLGALLGIPAQVHFASYEPALGPVDWSPWVCDGGPALDWIICGGESGPGARPMHPRWALDTLRACRLTGTAFHFKQWGEWMPVFHGIDPSANDPECTVHEAHLWPDGQNMWRVGKKASGRMLGFRIWDEFPVSKAGEVVR